MTFPKSKQVTYEYSWLIGEASNIIVSLVYNFISKQLLFNLIMDLTGLFISLQSIQSILTKFPESSLFIPLQVKQFSWHFERSPVWLFDKKYPSSIFVILMHSLKSSFIYNPNFSLQLLINPFSVSLNFLVESSTIS